MARYDDWLTKAHVLESTGITQTQLLSWHTEILAHMNELMLVKRGKGRGSETIYHPLTLPTVRRILELKSQGHRDMDFWRWQLWLDGFPIDIKRECIFALEQMVTEIEEFKGDGKRDTLDVIEEAVTNVSGRASSPLISHIEKRIKDEADRHAFLVWLMQIGVGEEPSAEWQHAVDVIDGHGLNVPPANNPYPTFGQLFAKTMGAPDVWAKTDPMQEACSIPTLLRVVEEASKEEWEQSRRDWQSIVRLFPYVPALEQVSKEVPVRVIAGLYFEAHVRAIVTGVLIVMHRSSIEDDLKSVLKTLGELPVPQ
jgi:hypothetical protein